jgi:hypothetical protein
MTERTNKRCAMIQRSDIIKFINPNFDYLNDANFKYSIKSTSDCFYITFKNTKGVFTWNDFKYDFIPLFEIIRERLRVDRKVEYFTKSYTKNADATDIIDDNIEDDYQMIGVIIRVYNSKSSYSENLFKFKK